MSFLVFSTLYSSIICFSSSVFLFYFIISYWAPEWFPLSSQFHYIHPSTILLATYTNMGRICRVKNINIAKIMASPKSPTFWRTALISLKHFLWSPDFFCETRPQGLKCLSMETPASSNFSSCCLQSGLMYLILYLPYCLLHLLESHS